MSGLIQQLIAASEMPLYLDARSGSFRDHSGNGNHGVPTDPLQWQGPNWHAGGATGVITVADAAELQLTALTLIVLGNFPAFTGGARGLIAKQDAGGVNYLMYLNNNPRVVLYDGLNYRTANFDYSHSKFLGVTCISGTVPKLYGDGIYISDFTGSSFITADDADVTIANNYSGTLALLSHLQVAMIINRVLTESEMAIMYSELAENGGPS